ncbi:MAG: hypothetical protein ACFE8L_06495 [Candidatus Hodarchaeota archaeon]
MPENSMIKENKVKIVIYQGYIHKISISDDIEEKKQNKIEKKVKNNEKVCSIQ